MVQIPTQLIQLFFQRHHTTPMDPKYPLLNVILDLNQYMIFYTTHQLPTDRPSIQHYHQRNLPE
ncbi:hypothetical protein CWM54_15240 [Klebsiella sp. D-Nf1]|nr:hypothetical protein CWM62_05355 [Klebsiella sp. C-Nf10]PJX52941.1 hypothetical protein CWM54_15240 [Klebsiella sp. D-Nf1]